MEPEKSNQSVSKGVSPWVILLILIVPAIVGNALAMSNNWLFSKNGDTIMCIILCLPLISGFVAFCLFLKDGQRIQLEEDSDYSTGKICARAMLVGIGCALGSGAILFGACFCTIQFAL